MPINSLSIERELRASQLRTRTPEQQRLDDALQVALHAVEVRTFNDRYGAPTIPTEVAGHINVQEVAHLEYLERLNARGVLITGRLNAAELRPPISRWADDPFGPPSISPPPLTVAQVAMQAILDSRLLAELTEPPTHSLTRSPVMDTTTEKYQKLLKGKAPITLDMFAPAKRVLAIGQLVEVRDTKAGWGNSSVTAQYIGVVTARNANIVSVIPVTGTKNDSQPSWQDVVRFNRPILDGIVIKLDDMTTTFANNGWVQEVFGAVSVRNTLRSHCRIIDHAELSTSNEWTTAANHWRTYRNAMRLKNRETVFSKLVRIINATYNDQWRNIRTALTRRAVQDNKESRSEFQSQLMRAVNMLRANQPVGFSTSRTVGAEHYLANQQETAQSRSLLMAVNKIRERDSMPPVYTADCGHFALRGTTAEVRNVRDTTGRVCSHCRNTVYNRDLLTREGDTVQVSDLYLRERQTFVWADGTRRTNSEPSIIGQYHSSRNGNKFYQLKNLDGTRPRNSTVNVGIEMEMQVKPNSIVPNTAAKLVSNRLAEAMARINQSGKPYAYFENDGSVSNGFEVVTNYGPIETHRAVIMDAFGVGQGNKYPFAGQLRSHDASCSCGIHVHLTKPESLNHASRLMEFYNNRGNAKLITEVARRYNNQYANFAPKTERERMEEKGYVARNASSYNYPVQEGMKYLHNESRYVPCNFINDKTVEIRVFKGSMIPTTILACVEFALMSWHFAKDTPHAGLTAAGFIDYINQPQWLKESGYLRAYLMARGYTTTTHKRGTRNVVAIEDFAGSE